LISLHLSKRAPNAPLISVLIAVAYERPKFANVFNGRRQLVSDIDRHLVTCMPQRKYFLAIRILVFDFELFIGGRWQKRRAKNSLKLLTF